MKSRTFQIVIALTFGLVCLYLFARGQDWAAVWEAMKGAHLGWALLAAILSVNSILIRAFRWQALLGKPRVSVPKLFLIANIGFMGNGIFPARMGELIRPFLIWRATPHKFSTALATIVVERVYDLMGLLLCLAFVFAVFPFPVDQASTAGAALEISVPADGGVSPDMMDQDPQEFIKGLAKLGVFVFAALFGAIAVMSFAPEWSLKIARIFFQPLPAGFSEKLLKAIESFEMGAVSFRKPGSFFYCVMWTLILWVSIAFSELVVLWALGVDSVSMIGALFIMAGLCFAVMFPQAPGYIGVYHFAVQLILVKTFFLDSTTATAAAWIMWLSQVPPVILSGFISLLIMGVSFKEISHVRDEVAETLQEPGMG
ncbi:MAG: lysylphosphatidylglycerol synthase transmembrane domain-containing protein [Candidatus Hinthialibacter sp.]